MDADSEAMSTDTCFHRFNPAEGLGMEEGAFASCLLVSWGKRLAIFDTGFIGIVPPQSQLGHSGYVLFGCSMPVILHEQAKGVSKRYRLVGECYVHGLSEGELFTNGELQDGLEAEAIGIA
jgi:hypothetical protein